jgi:hypothetical protein
MNILFAGEGCKRRVDPISTGNTLLLIYFIDKGQSRKLFLYLDLLQYYISFATYFKGLFVF